MKRYVLMIVCVCIVVYPLSIEDAIAAEPPEISAQAAAMIDTQSGRFLYEKNADETKPIASITKIMTAIIAIEHGDLDKEVAVSPNAVGKEGSSIYLKKGEKITLHNLLYGLMLRSGNDAAVAIAEHIGGSVDGFVLLMNEKAQYLGMTNTHFANPHGLDADNHYSTARDMAKLTAYALRNEVFQEIVATKSIKVPNPGEKWDRKWYNKNKMLQMYAGADGVKTGYTSKARRTLVSSATREGQQIVTVTLNAADDWNDSMALMDYGFQHYQLRTLVDEQDFIEDVVDRELAEQGLRVAPEHSFTYPLTEEEQSAIEKKVDIPGELPQGLKEGISVGEVLITLDGKKIGSVPLITKGEHDDASSLLFERWVTLLSPLWSETAP